VEHILVYRDPFDYGPLDRESGGLRNPRTNALYPFRDGIPVFAMPAEIDGPNTRYQRLYDRFAPFYDLSTRLYAWLKSGAEETRRSAYLKLLGIAPVGTVPRGSRLARAPIGPTSTAICNSMAWICRGAC
jgi:hypothetical protein